MSPVKCWASVEITFILNLTSEDLSRLVSWETDGNLRSIDIDLREQLLEFEKEFKDVNEIVKKENIRKSIEILLKNSKSSE